MNARRAARELALLTLYQMDRQGLLTDFKVERVTIEDLILNAVRSLVHDAQEQIESSAKDLAVVSQGLLEYEMHHPKNLATPMDAPLIPVPVPTTRQTIEKIERCLQAAEWLHEACRLPELAALARREEVRDYAVRLITLAIDKQADIDEKLNAVSTEWRVDRIMKVDQYILRAAAAEMLYVDSVDPGVSIDEAVELAKIYSEEESYRFINGVLGGLAGRPVETAETTESGSTQPELKQGV